MYSESLLTYSLANRVLFANIHNLGRCPCPRCLIPKDQVQNVATDSDMVQCQMSTHRDTVEHHNKIASARSLIYEKGYVVDTAQVEAKLKDESLVPTVVSIISEFINNAKQVFARMHFRTGWAIQVLTSFSC